MHQQKAYFAQVFDTVAPNYDQIGPPFHAAFGRRFVQAAELQPGARLLDVACGRGATLLPAAEIAGADGIAVGVDISGGMARVAAADARRRGLAHVTTARMDGEQLAFRAGTFDAVLCSAALFFFPDEERALREFYRVLAPGGLAGYTVYQRVEPDHEYAWMFEILARYQRPPGEPEPEPES
ncbi:MAG: methyltransferase domain-containing protein, partial [Anaerolineae bacterium]|nr:methyltransferase domain-containing protein [Anaerolineae bacterium]